MSLKENKKKNIVHKTDKTDEIVEKNNPKQSRMLNMPDEAIAQAIKNILRKNKLNWKIELNGIYLFGMREYYRFFYGITV